MTPEELCEIIKKPEGIRLEFKSEYALTSDCPSAASYLKKAQETYIECKWDEFAKDIIGLANGGKGR